MCSGLEVEMEFEAVTLFSIRSAAHSVTQGIRE